MGRTLIMIHGRYVRASRRVQRCEWVQSLATGIRRDQHDILPQFCGVRKELLYYFDLETLSVKHRSPPVAERWAKRAFAWITGSRKLSGARRQPRPPRRHGWLRELGHQTFGVLSHVGVIRFLFGLALPEMSDYWNDQSLYYQSVQSRLRKLLRRAWSRGDSVCVVAHSLGTIVCYDGLRGLLESPPGPRPAHGVDLLVTLGSPLGDESVKRRLRRWIKAAQTEPRMLVRRWVNVAREDDLFCHDAVVADDFAAEVQCGRVGQIVDRLIQARHDGPHEVSPHSLSSYLAHPVTAQAIAQWLRSP